MSCLYDAEVLLAMCVTLPLTLGAFSWFVPFFIYECLCSW